MPAFLSSWAGRGELGEGCLLTARCQACLLLEGGDYHLEGEGPQAPVQVSDLAWVESSKQFLVAFCMKVVVLEMVPRLTLNRRLTCLDISAL